MKSVWLPFFLFLLTATTMAADPQPKPSEKAPDLEKLLTLYRQFELPLPPEHAELLRVPLTQGMAIVNGKQVRYYGLGFSAKPKGEKIEGCWQGPLWLGPEEFSREAPKPIRAEDVQVSELELDSFGSSIFRMNLGPGLAVQCYQQGHRELALKLLNAASEVQDHEGPNAVSAGGAWQRHRRGAAYLGREGDPTETLVGGLAWTYWMNQLVKPQTNLAHAHEVMKKIVAEVPVLNDPPREELLESLAATLAAPKSPPGSVAEAIDGLVDSQRGVAREMGKRDAPYDRVLLLGFQAIPELLKHISDQRFTRAIVPGFNNFPTMPCTMGELVSDLLRDLIGTPHEGDWLERQLGRTLDPETARKWWATAEKAGEEKFLLAHVLPSGAKADSVREAHLRILEQRYPQHLGKVYLELLDQRPQLQSWSVVEAIGRSALPSEEKLRLLQYGATRAKLEHRKAAMRELRALDPAAVDAMLIPILNRMPAKTKGPVWTSEESGLAHLVLQSDSDAVWAAFEEALLRAHVSLRMELLNPFDYTYVGEKNLERRIATLAKFLDDQTERNEKDDPKLYDGPSAAFTFPRITVRDFAAMQLGSLLKLTESPELEWSAHEWDAFRAKVRGKLASRKK